ncbi:MAG: hypothetical protein ACN6N1_14045 [Acinetobacter guillouiae]|uniref:hypothetical protein n=1 Tax=Acinetobacter guillouiae TaxID=106649 RepID=UPI001CD1BBDA|nr:hypothetical protein [Acinetobacter guillouiae]
MVSPTVGATWMSPLGGGTGRTPAKHEQKQSTALFVAQGLASPTKSEASPTQRYSNFEGKVWHCKLFDNQTIYFPIQLI